MNNEGIGRQLVPHSCARTTTFQIHEKPPGLTLPIRRQVLHLHFEMIQHGSSHSRISAVREVPPTAPRSTARLALPPGSRYVSVSAPPRRHVRQQGLRQARRRVGRDALRLRSEEHTSELQSLITISYAVFC